MSGYVGRQVGTWVRGYVCGCVGVCVRLWVTRRGQDNEAYLLDVRGQAIHPGRLPLGPMGFGQAAVLLATELAIAVEDALQIFFPA